MTPSKGVVRGLRTHTNLRFDRPACTNLRFDQPACTNLRFDRPACTNLRFDRPACTNLRFDRPACTNLRFDRPACTNLCFDRPACTNLEIGRNAPQTTPGHATHRKSRVAPSASRQHLMRLRCHSNRRARAHREAHAGSAAPLGHTHRSSRRGKSARPAGQPYR